MRDTKLYKTLSHLGVYELNKLHRFILSPYFNKNEAISLLFEWIKEDLREKDNGKLKKTTPTKEHIWSLCFKEKAPYDDARFRKLQSDLLRLVEDFLAQIAFETNPFYKAKFLLESLNGRNLEHLEPSAIKNAMNCTDEQQLKPSSYYYHKYELEQARYILRRHKAERSSKTNIESIDINLDRFYLAEKLRYYSTILTHQHFVAVDYKMLFIDEIISHVKAHDYSDVPAILIYYQILLTYKEPNNRNHYELLSAYLKKYINLFPAAEAKEILDAVLNYCIIRMNSGEEEYVREAFNLYVDALDKGFLLVNGQITPWSFKNIVTAGLRLHEFNWVENFINEFKYKIDEKFRDNAVTFNLAQFYFYKKEYHNVIEQLSKVEYEDFTYSLNSKTLLMASYYELDEMEALNSFLDTFRLYIDRNKKLTQGKGKHYKNTIAIVRKLSRIVPGQQKEIEKLKQEINTTKGIVSKNWILEKLAKLETSPN